MNRLLIPGVVVAVLALTCAASGTAAAATAEPDTIPSALAPLGAEHDNLRASFAFVLRGATSPRATRVERLTLVGFLRNTLLPHAQDEELVLYPALDSVLGTQGFATATMVLDHRAIANQTLELATLVDGDPEAFHRKAVYVTALVDHHFANEEEFVLPNLARRMGDRALRALLERLHGSGHTP